LQDVKHNVLTCWYDIRTCLDPLLGDSLLIVNIFIKYLRFVSREELTKLAWF